MARPKSNRRTVRLSVTLDEDDYKVVRDMAESMDLSTAWMVRRAVTEFIERHGREDAMPLRNGDERAA
jgi:predicted transcriptional regulator